MNEEASNSPKPVADLGPKPGFISGTAVVRDKDGNIKGEFSFGGPATPQEIEAMKKAHPNL